MNLKKIEKKLQPKKDAAAHESPRDELKRLALEHKALMKRAVAIDNMGSDKKNRETGETIKCRLPEDVMVDLQAVADGLRERAGSLEKLMLKQLRQIPIYKLFLKEAAGVGTIIATYLISEIDIEKCENFSQLKKFVGLATDQRTGALDRPTKGEKLSYSSEMRMRLFQMFQSIWKNAARGMACKYLDVWTDYKNRMAHSERYDEKTNRIREFSKGAWVKKPGAKVDADGWVWTSGGKAFIHSTGWHKAADVFLEDLYILWRTLEGLPVRPSYYSEKLYGRAHSGKIEIRETRVLSLDEALSVVGNFTWRPAPSVAAE